jgi:hypothetical protein
MARAVPRLANIMRSRRAPSLETAIQSSTIATIAPATGVHKPQINRAPAATTAACSMTPRHWGAPRSTQNPSWISRVPVTSRRRRRALPGQPLGNMENSRCRVNLRLSVRGVQRYRIPKTWDAKATLSRGYKSMMPRFSPMVTAWVRSFAPSFERMFLTWPLTVSSVIDN